MNEFIAGFVVGMIFLTLWIKSNLLGFVFALVLVFAFNAIGAGVNPIALMGVMSSMFFTVGLMGVWGIVQTHLAKSWPVTESDVVLSVVDEVGRRYPQFRVHLRCNYKVDGKTYTCERLDFGSLVFLFRDEADNVVERYREGTKTQVHFNPTSPKDSVLSLHLRRRLVIGPIIMFSCSAFLAYIALARV